MTFAQLEQLWIAQGGDPSMAPVMAAIAMAESTGNPSNTTGDGGTSYGLWQVHWTVHPQFNPSELLDPSYNAQAAIQLSGNGQNLSPWTTWQSYVNGDGGHGDQVISSILGPYVPGATSSAPAGTSSSSSASSASTSTAAPAPWDIPGQIRAAGQQFSNTATAIGSTAIVTAVAITFLLIGGIWLALGNKDIRQITYSAGKKATEAALAA